MPKDFKGKELKVGDRVIYITGSYRDLSWGTIVKLNSLQATVQPTKGGAVTFRYYSSLIKGDIEL